MTAFLGTWVINLVTPSLLGIWLGRRTVRKGRLDIAIVFAAMLMMFALLYLNGLRSDWLYLNTCWEGSAPLHVFGPNWSVDLLMKALKGLPLAMIILGASAWVTHKTVQTRGNQVPE